MKIQSKYFLQIFLVTSFALGLGSINAFAGGSVVPPTQKAFDMTYEEWTARWGQFVFGLPAVDNPLNDTTGALCGKGQWGPVIFLFGSPGSGTVTRTCTVSTKKGFLIPLINWIGASPDDDATPEGLAALLDWVVDQVDVSTLSASIDGIPVQNMAKFRFRSPVFSFTGSSPNIFSEACSILSPTCYEGFHEQGMGEGYYILVNPLSPGKHTIHVHGEAAELGVIQDVTYQLTVVP